MSTRLSDPSEFEAKPSRRDLILIYATLGPPVIWALQLTIHYVASPHLCDATWAPVLHLVTLLALAATGLALAAAWRIRRELPADARDPTSRRVRAMAWGGVLFSSFFLVVIVAQGLPAMAIDHCLLVGGTP